MPEDDVELFGGPSHQGNASDDVVARRRQSAAYECADSIKKAITHLSASFVDDRHHRLLHQGDDVIGNRRNVLGDGP